MRCGNERPYFTVAGTKAQGSEETFLRWHVSGRDEIETQALGPWSVWLTQLCSVQCGQGTVQSARLFPASGTGRETGLLEKLTQEGNP